MPPPTTLVLAQILTSMLSNDSSVAELLRRQATFLEDTTLPAPLQARGAAIFHHALFTETPNAIPAGKPVIEILRKTVVRAGELYLENERGPVVKSEGDDGVGVEQAAKHGGDEDEEEGVQDGEAARMGQAMKDDRCTAKETSARAGRKRMRKEEEEDSNVDDPDGDDFNAESQRATEVIAIRPNRQIHDKISALVAANAAKTLPARIALEKKRSERARLKVSSTSTRSESMAPFTDTAAQSTSTSSTSNTHPEGDIPLAKPRSKRNTTPPPKRFGTHRKRRVRAPPTFSSLRALPFPPHLTPEVEQPKPSLIVVLSIPHLGAVVKALGSNGPEKKKRKKVKKSELSSEFVRDEDDDDDEDEE
jgi:hypothetical protein